MAKSSNQKLKLIYLARILQEKTDEEHGLSMQEIIEELARYDVKAAGFDYVELPIANVMDLKCLRCCNLFPASVRVTGEEADYDKVRGNDRIRRVIKKPSGFSGRFFLDWNNSS